MLPNPQLNNFLLPYSEEIQKLTIDLRNFVTDLIPEANELIWDNYNAVAIAYSKSEKLKDAFCHIAVYSKHVNFGFNRGTELDQSILPLKGKGKLIRHITVKNMNLFPMNGIKTLLKEAFVLSDQLNPNLPNSETKSIVMSVSSKKLRPKS